jgi:citrate lyase subunit beta/citryl-CoA lyase
MSLYRSWMFVPGNQPRRIEKVKNLFADVIIYDLEDAVAVSEKETAQQLVAEAIQQYKGRTQFVRINDRTTPFYIGDLEAVICSELTGIILSKTEGPEDIRETCEILTKIERDNCIEIGTMQIVPLIESASGVFHAYQIAAASKERVKRLAFGSVDYTLDINAQLTKEGTELLYARSQLVIHSRAAGIEAPIDAVYIHIKDTEGLNRDARFAKQLGFQGKLIVHPDQIGPVHDIFSPTLLEIAEATAISAAFDEAVLRGNAAIQLNGKMIDYPVAARAKKIIDQAKLLDMA